MLQEMLELGKTPEEVCRDCPELLAEVRQRWQDFQLIDVQVRSLLPGLATRPAAGATAPLPAGLPQVPGYEVECELGRGGMGVVYKARHLALKRTVALKTLIGVSADQAERVRFRIEAEAVARLQHPYIVQVHEISEAGGLPFLALEFIAGGSLAKRLAGQPLPPRDAAGLMEKLAEAMHLAHSRNLVHRDLKPANILLTDGDETPISQSQPKVADFGLARQLDSDSGQTQVGAVMGTPSYMAPEQAEGRAHAAGPAADVYSLGATLYECLTGRPPFHGATPLDTLEQVRTREPASPSSLNRQIPRDLETICLKCLRKQPEQRYSSAHELGMDLGRFLRGEPVAARPIGVAERLRKWVRRRPAVAGLLAAAGLWLVQQRTQRRAELRREVDTAVDQAKNLRKGFHFREARALLEQAQQVLGPDGPDDLRRQVDQELANLELVENLDKARLRAASPRAGRLAIGRAESLYDESLYEETFAKAGLGGPGDDSKAAAARVRNSAVHAELVAALDDWASITPDRARRAWLLAVAREADPDPAVRDRLRQPELWDDGPRLMKLVKELPVDKLSPQLTTALGRVSLDDKEKVRLLSAAQARDPHDFWLNFALGRVLFESRRYHEALGYYRAALALRPQASEAHNNIGATLKVLDRWDEAIGHFKQALKTDPNVARFHYNLGVTLLAKGRQDEAISHFREAISHDQKAIANRKGLAGAHMGIGIALEAKGQQDQAISYYQKAIRLDPETALFHNNLAMALWTKGRQDEAIRHYQEAIRLDPKAAVFHYNLGCALRDKGRLDEAIDHLRKTIELEPTSTGAPPALASVLLRAARADIATAAGQGSKASQLSESERSHMRRDALARLRANLALMVKRLHAGKAADWSVADWQTDPALASVREPAALAKLPDAERAEWQRLWADVAAIAATDPLDEGPTFAARRDWAKAADAYAWVLKHGPNDDGHFWFEYAALSLLSGDRPGYAKACAHMIETVNKAGGPRAYHVARACTLAPDAVADAALPGRLAEKELQGAAKQFWSLTEQGALAYRSGQFQDSVPLFEQSLRADATPGRAVVNWVWLALAHQRLGQSEDARRWLGKAQAWLDQYKDGMPANAEEELGLHLHNWLEAHVLRREAEALIPPAEKR
jgi:serine/threonine-protein kinase